MHVAVRVVVDHEVIVRSALSVVGHFWKFWSKASSIAEVVVEVVELQEVTVCVRDHVVGHVVEGEVVVECVLDAIIKAKEVLAHRALGGRLPGLIEDTAGLLVVSLPPQRRSGCGPCGSHEDREVH